MDANFCIKAHTAGVRLVDVGAPVYHVGRGTLHAQKGAFRSRPADAPWGDKRWHKDVLYANGEGWGLGAAPERQIDARTTFLDFDWTAVCPMVDLTRVVSPRQGKGPA
jgi:hypothetical protein